MARKKSRKARKNEWIDAITQDCKGLGVYKTAFNPAIEMLADVMVQREDVWKEFEDSGGKTMLPYTNKGGSENFVKNPILVMWNELTKTALAYRRELGLTPAGLRKLDEKAMKSKKRSPLAEALRDLG